MVDCCSEECTTRCVVKITVAIAVVQPIGIVFKQTIWLLHRSVSGKGWADDSYVLDVGTSHYESQTPNYRDHLSDSRNFEHTRSA